MSKEAEGCCKNAQKQMVKIVNFVHTSSVLHAIIINVKTPQYIIWFLLHPIVKIPSPKKAVTLRPVFFTMIMHSKKDSQIHLKSASQMGFAHA